MSTEKYTPSEPNLDPILESGQDAAKILFRNSTFYLGADTIIKVLGFIFSIYVVRQLGDERFGAYSTALAYAGIFSIIGDLGMTQYATREIARGRKKPDDFFWNLVVLRLFLALIATLLITASAYYAAGYQPAMVLGIFLVCISFFFHALLGPINVVLISKERVDYTSILNTIIQIIFVSVGTWVLFSGYSFYSLIVASYIGIPLAAVAGIVYIRRLKLANLKFNITPHIWLSILKFSWPFALITFTIVAARDADTVLLSLWRSPEEVGWYKAAYNLIFKLLFIKGALLTTIGPQMARYYGVSPERVRKTFNAAFKLLWTFSFPVALGGTILAQSIILWLYTDEYYNSIIVFAILVWALPLLNLSSLCGQVTTATDKEKKAVRVYMAAALLNLGSNAIAIPIWGYVGAAASTVLTEAIALIFFYGVLHKEFPLTDLRNTLLKPFFAGIIMAALILLLQTQGLHVILLIILGALTYAVSLLIMKPFNQLETELMHSFWLSLRRKIGWSTS